MLEISWQLGAPDLNKPFPTANDYPSWLQKNNLQYKQDDK